jgi:hypothetical protein
MITAPPSTRVYRRLRGFAVAVFLCSKRHPHGADEPLFDGDEVPIGETRCGFDLASLREPLLKGRHVDENFVGGGISSSPLPPK